MRVAFFSDIHGNLPALEAVLADVAADRRGPPICAWATSSATPPWPNEVLDRLQAEAIPGVLGNYDEGTGFELPECGCAYVDPDEKRLGDRSFAWTKEQVTDANKAWLRSLPREIRFEADGLRYLLVHGSPRRINEYLYEDKPDATFARIAAGAAEDDDRVRPHASPVRQAGWSHAIHQRRIRGQAQGRRLAGGLGAPRHDDGQADRPTRRIRRRARCGGNPGSDLPHVFAVQLREARGYRPTDALAEATPAS